MAGGSVTVPAYPGPVSAIALRLALLLAEGVRGGNAG